MRRAVASRPLLLYARRAVPALCRAVPTAQCRAFEPHWSLLPRRRAYHEASAEDECPQNGSSAPARVIDAVQRRFSALGSAEAEAPALPDAALVQEAIAHVGRNGYLAWPLYAHLRQRGFEERVVRTDYRFASKRRALETLRFFFGKGVANRAKAQLEALNEDSPCIVPEFTGVWWKQRKEPHERVAALEEAG